TGLVAALKVLRKGAVHDGARFVREAEILAAHAHPSIVRYIAHGVMPSGERYLAMEWLEGETLADHLARGRLTVAQSVAFGAQVALALAEVHRQGVVHRDLKPGNIFLRGGALEAAMLIDFGLARSAHASTKLTVTGAILGTPAYMAPEQARGEIDI